MLDDPEIPPVGELPIDNLSKQENEKLFVRGIREMELETVGHKITIWLLRITIIIIVLVGGLRLLHLILPESCKWLTEEQTFKIDEFFIHGTFGALIVEFLRDKMPKKKKHG